MAIYVGEEEFWKCPKHPSKRRRNGVCPTCLRDRLGILCPDCANIRPCGFCTTTTSSSASSSSSSISLFSTTASCQESMRVYTKINWTDDYSRVITRVGNLIESEPKFERSKSVAVNFMRSRFSTSGRENLLDKVKTTLFWGLIKNSKRRKGETENRNEKSEDENLDEENCYYNSKIGDFERMMMKSRSMRGPISSENGGGDAKVSLKGKSWHFPSPIKVFRQRSKVVQDRSPLQRY